MFKHCIYSVQLIFLLFSSDNLCLFLLSSKALPPSWPWRHSVSVLATPSPRSRTPPRWTGSLPSALPLSSLPSSSLLPSTTSPTHRLSGPKRSRPNVPLCPKPHQWRWKTQRKCCRWCFFLWVAQWSDRILPQGALTQHVLYYGFSVSGLKPRCVLLHRESYKEDSRNLILGFYVLVFTTRSCLYLEWWQIVIAVSTVSVSRQMQLLFKCKIGRQFVESVEEKTK